MINKGIVCILLLSGCLQIFATDYPDKSSVVNNDNFHNTEINSFETHETENRKDFEAAKQFQKDYIAWGDKKYQQHEYKEVRDNINNLKFKVGSKEYDEKYKKFDKKPDDFNIQKDKPYHKKGDSEKEEKPGSLIDDVNVNYLNKNIEISKDSEVLSERAMIKSKEKYEENYQNKNELYMKRFKKNFYQNLIKIDLTNPPNPNDTVLMARYIVHSVDWASLGTLSGRSPTKGSPFVCVKATSDGMKNESSGIPFFYMSSMDICTQDLEKDNRVSVLVTLLETDYCKKKDLDPQDPRCAKLTLSGKIKKIKPGSDEEKFAKNALFSRHPAMTTWPVDHHFYFTKLKIGQIILLDQFGGATYVKVKDYLNGKVTEPELKKK